MDCLRFSHPIAGPYGEQGFDEIRCMSSQNKSNRMAIDILEVLIVKP